MEITVKHLIELLSLEDQDSPVYFGGLDFYRIKDRGGMVQIEFNQSVDKDEYGLVWVTNHQINYITAYDRNRNREVFFVREEERQATNDCNFTGSLYTIFTKEKPQTGFVFELLLIDGQYYIKYVDNQGIPHVSGKGIYKAMLFALTSLIKGDIYSSTYLPHKKLYLSEGLVSEAEQAWKKWQKELSNVEHIVDEGRYVFRYHS